MMIIIIMIMIMIMIMIGGGVAAQVARQRKHVLNGVVLESTFSAIESLFPSWFPRVMIRDPFRTEAVLSQIDVPVLIIHGVRDETIPVAHAIKMHHIGGSKSTLLLHQGTHNEMGSKDEASYCKSIRDFVGKCNHTDKKVTVASRL